MDLINDDQAKKLASFLKQTEGDPPPVFVGRTDVIDDIALAADQVWKDNCAVAHGSAKTTRIIQGAPGAGKSSTLNEIARNPDRLRLEICDATPTILTLNSGDIMDPVDILRPLAEKMNPPAARRFLAQISQSFSGEMGAGPGPLKVAGQMETTSIGHPPRADWAMFGAWVQQHGGFTRPVILAIDEAQRFDRSPDDPLAKLLQGLHDGCGLPITLVLAGLSNTEASADQMSLTRIPFKQTHNIGCFPIDESIDFMHQSCSYFGIDITGFESRTDRLAETCEGWPRHLHIALRALGEEAMKAGGELGQVNWEKITQEAKVGRDGYYAQQYSNAMKGAKSLTLAVMADLDHSKGRAEIKKLIRTLHVADADTYCFPPLMDTNTFFDHLVRKGALHEQSTDRFACPIPSFRTYLLEQGKITPPP